MGYKKVGKACGSPDFFILLVFHTVPWELWEAQSDV